MVSQRSQQILANAVADQQAATEILAGITGVAADVAAIGTQTPGTDQASTNVNIAAIQAKVDAILAALKAAGIMA